MRSQLTAQFMPFFRLIAHLLTFCDKKYHILTFCNKKYHILTFCDKTELYLTVLQQNNVEACLRCCSPALSGSLLLSQSPYCSPNLRTTSSLGLQGPCSARSCAATLSAALHMMNTTQGNPKQILQCNASYTTTTTTNATSSQKT